VLVASAVCLASLFLPWQRACFDRKSEFGAVSGRCFSTNAWTSTAASAAALLVLALVALHLAPIAGLSMFEVISGIALFVATLGFALVDRDAPGQRLSFGYGAFVGFAATAALVALAVVGLRPEIDRRRLLECVAPILACVAYVTIVLLPRWQVLSSDADRELRFGPFSWLAVADVLLALHLLGRWARRLRPLPPADPFLWSLPLLLLALTALDLIEQRDRGLTWGGGIAVGLCLALAACGRIALKGGIRAVRVPEILRIDRIS
jgi:heme exporter protein D